MSTHVVQSGETLSGIARNAGVSLTSLLRANPSIRNPDVIRAGQTINVPAPSGLRLDERFLNGSGLRFPRRSFQRPTLFAPGELTFQRQLPPWRGSTLTLEEVTRILERGLPPNVIVSLYGGPGCQAGYAGLCSLLGDSASGPAQPSVSFPGLPTPNIDFGTQVSVSDKVAAEFYASLVIRASAVSFADGRFDLFNQPTAQVTLGLGLDASTWGSLESYIAMQLSVTVFNIHVLRSLDGYDVLGSPQYHDVFELGIGQVGVGVQQDGTGVQGSGQAGVSAELHLTRTFSLTASGVVTLVGTGSGLQPQLGPATVGVVYHSP